MEPADMADVLSAAAVYDGRTIGRTDIAAWHAAVGHLDRDDALAAVVRHYSTSTDRLMPAHLRAEVQAIRNERAEQQHHPIRQLASPFQLDEIRDERIRRGIATLRAGWSVPTNANPGDPHAAALERARRERRQRGGSTPQMRKAPRDSKPIDLARVTTGPDWATAEAREREAVAALHKAGRACGKPACPRDTCKAQRAAA